MKAAEYIVDFLIKKGVTDAFGLPGGVILELLYAMDKRKGEFAPHLTYHEQGAAFAAIGYAQASGRLGVAYSTRGPGLTNMITGIADAYYDSAPVLFVTAHDSPGKKPGMRIQNNQEMDTVLLVSSITKYAARVDALENLPSELEKAYSAAMSGRRGPVLLDIYTPLLRKEIAEAPPGKDDHADTGDVTGMAREAVSRIASAQRPVILIGNGVRQSGTGRLVRQLAEQCGIPVLSSRAAQDIMPDSPVYFGFVGSHALRHANFILSKSDLILALGNRLAFPVNSQSFRPIVEKNVILRVDADQGEFLREVPGSINCLADLAVFLPALLEQSAQLRGTADWIAVCQRLRDSLWQWDKDAVSDSIISILAQGRGPRTIVCDVGNHSFQVTNAYTYAKAADRILYSNSFGALGCALPKAVGACRATRRPVVCFAGDQGFQLNVQELQMLAGACLPITVVVLNNRASAMIRDREKAAYEGRFLHTTPESGYAPPPLQALAQAYGLPYYRMEPGQAAPALGDGPCLVELMTEADKPLLPMLPRGAACQDMRPPLPPELYQELDSL